MCRIGREFLDRVLIVLAESEQSLVASSLFTKSYNRDAVNYFLIEF